MAMRSLGAPDNRSAVVYPRGLRQPCAAECTQILRRAVTEEEAAFQARSGQTPPHHLPAVVNRLRVAKGHARQRVDLGHGILHLARVRWAG